MYQILTDKNFKKAVKEIPLNNTNCVFSSPQSCYEVWELTYKDWNILSSYHEKYDYFEEGENPLLWKDSWGWWKQADDSVIKNYSAYKNNGSNKREKIFPNKNRQNDYLIGYSEDFIDQYEYETIDYNTVAELRYGYLKDLKEYEEYIDTLP